MAHIYPVTSGKNLIIYALNQHINLKIVSDNYDRNIILANDYSNSLSDTLHNGSIYYVYINSRQDMCLKTIVDPSPVFMLSKSESPDYASPQIISYREHLLLIYILNNPVDNNYLIRCILPLSPDTTICFPHRYTTPPVIHCVQCNSMLALLIEHDGICSFCYIDESLSLKELTPKESDTAPYKAMIKERDEIIESIKAQYQELMETAIRYRDEANKWYRKFTG